MLPGDITIFQETTITLASGATFQVQEVHIVVALSREDGASDEECGCLGFHFGSGFHLEAANGHGEKGLIGMQLMVRKQLQGLAERRQLVVEHPCDHQSLAGGEITSLIEVAGEVAGDEWSTLQLRDDLTGGDVILLPYSLEELRVEHLDVDVPDAVDVCRDRNVVVVMDGRGVSLKVIEAERGGGVQDLLIHWLIVVCLRASAGKSAPVFSLMTVEDLSTN